MSDNHILLSTNPYTLEGYENEANYSIKILRNALPRTREEGEFSFVVWESMFRVISELRCMALDIMQRFHNNSYEFSNETAFYRSFRSVFETSKQEGRIEGNWEDFAYFDATISLELNVKFEDGTWRKLQIGDNTYPYDILHQLDCVEMALVKDKPFVQSYQKASSSTSSPNTNGTSPSTPNNVSDAPFYTPLGTTYKNPLVEAWDKKSWLSETYLKKPLAVKVDRVERQNADYLFQNLGSDGKFYQLAKVQLNEYFSNEYLAKIPVAESLKFKGDAYISGFVQSAKGKDGTFYFLSVKQLDILDEKDKARFDLF